jgi:hypothetical protein
MTKIRTLYLSAALAVASIAGLVLAITSALAWEPAWATLWLVTAIYTRHRAGELRDEWRATHAQEAADA